MRQNPTTTFIKPFANIVLATGLMFGGGEVQASGHAKGENTEQHELGAHVTTGIQSGTRIHGITGDPLCTDATEIRPSVSFHGAHFSASMIESTGKEVCKVNEYEGEFALEHGISAGAGYSQHKSSAHTGTNGHDEKKKSHPDFWEVHLTYNHHISNTVQGFITAEGIYSEGQIIGGGKIGLSASKKLWRNTSLQFTEALYWNERGGFVSDTRLWVLWALNHKRDTIGIGIERRGTQGGAYVTVTHPFGKNGD